MAEQRNPTVHLVAELRKRMACIHMVDPVRFAEAVSSYLESEAVAYWARPALERGPEPPKAVSEGASEPLF